MNQLDPSIRVLLQIAGSTFGGPAIGTAVGAAVDLTNRLIVAHGEAVAGMSRAQVEAALAALPPLPPFVMETGAGDGEPVPPAVGNGAGAG